MERDHRTRSAFHGIVRAWIYSLILQYASVTSIGATGLLGAYAQNSLH
jgi:hypothetical protein